MCGACLKKPPAYDRAIAAFSYAHPVDAMIQALKYGDRRVCTEYSLAMVELSKRYEKVLSAQK